MIKAKVNLMIEVNSSKKATYLYVKNNKQLGFTLIEILITVAIVGILASIAYPSYTDYVNRSSRSEGQRELLRYANIQEQVYVDSRSYAANMKGLGASTNTIDTENGKYTLSVSAQTATTFTLQASAKGSQTSDTGCTVLTIDEIGVKGPSACWDK